MKDVFLVNYSVRGIKTLDKLVSLSYYKKTISRNLDTQEYNVKGIYGMNGSGKSGIVTSVDILKNLLINSGYLNNPIVQKNLEAIINKKIGELFIEADYIAKFANVPMYFRYSVTLSKDITGKYTISKEQLFFKKATSKNDEMMKIFEICNGEIAFVDTKDDSEFSNLILKKTTNLLSTASMSALFCEKILAICVNNETYKNFLFVSLCVLLIFGKKLHVFMDQSDAHREYLLQKSLKYFDDLEKNNSEISSLMRNFIELDKDYDEVIQVSGNLVLKEKYSKFENTIEKLCEFIRIFKTDLIDIEIEKKEDQTIWVCNLIMIYDSYKIHAEFESTGIKKLIRLFAYIKEMVQGDIVFIDELDSNLHDVYLCALLEYLMEYGEGQLCFTTHNVGPMDILKQNKKSIDFLSIDGNIYPWITNGNYSPSKLYRNGMIEGSPFNVDSIDFIGIFGLSEGDE